VLTPLRLRPCLLGLAALAAAAAPVPTPTPNGPLAPPAHDWILPLFTREGYRELTAKGSEVQPLTADQLEVKMMTVTTFVGGANPKVDAVITSPTATFFIDEKTARGDHAVRLVRDDMTVDGEGWTYDYNQKTVLIFHHVHVVFHSALPDLLK